MAIAMVSMAMEAQAGVPELSRVYEILSPHRHPCADIVRITSLLMAAPILLWVVGEVRGVVRSQETKSLLARGKQGLGDLRLRSRAEAVLHLAEPQAWI